MMRWTLILLVLSTLPGFACGGEIVRIGTEVKELEPFDRHVAELMEKYELPGATVAVAKDGRLVYVRGFGWSDRKKRVGMPPMALMRIASVSKPITAAAILQLIEQGRLKLKDPILPYLRKFGAEEEKRLDPRWRQITIEHLLRHTAGFDREKSGDPMFMSQRPRPPLDQAAIIRFMLGRPLDFDPGTRYAYSNFGYCLLGRVIEAVTGKRYEEAVREMVLRPAGISRMRLGKTGWVDRADGEVVYHMGAKANRCKSVFPEQKGLVDEPYGDFYLEALDSHGGWIASAVDLVRFATALDGERGLRLLTPESIEKTQSVSDPPVYLGKTKDHYYGLGWVIASRPKGKYWYHDGVLAGTRSLLMRYHDGVVMAVLVNGQPADKGNFPLEFGQTLLRSAKEVKKWPKGDLFSTKPYSK